MMYPLSLEAAKDYIETIDFSRIIQKMVSHQSWTKEDALSVCRLYRNFLYLQKKYYKQYVLPPSEEIDEFWHLHILDTGKYKKDCEVIFGEILHHYPYFGMDDQSTLSDLQMAFEKMQSLYEQEFGEKIHEVRSIGSKLLPKFKKWLMPFNVLFSGS